MNDSVLDIGFDDTDSPKGMCTTFLAYKIVNMLRKQNVRFLDFPRLIRFNPNIPWKTRGNGAVSLKIKTDDAANVKKKVTEFVEKYSDIKNGANPGLVFCENMTIPNAVCKFGDLALWQLISRDRAKRLARENELEFFYMGNGQGLVGAIGAVGYTFYDHTFELLSYRRVVNFGKRRQISSSSVQQIHEKNPDIFNSFDEKRQRVLITPHGPDPVFYGIRGERTSALLRAAKILKIGERLDGYMIFKTNQGTGDHLKNSLEAADIRPYVSGTLKGVVKTNPEICKGGHVFLTIACKNHELRCAIYKPTRMSHVALGLVPGDEIHIGGGIRKASKRFPRVLNVEFIEILGLKNLTSSINPICIECSKSMKSKGSGQGYQCARCGRKAAQRQILKIPRKIKEQMYLPASSAQRHLTRPMQRIKNRNKQTKFKESDAWVCENKH